MYSEIFAMCHHLNDNQFTTKHENGFNFTVEKRRLENLKKSRKSRKNIIQKQKQKLWDISRTIFDTHLGSVIN